MGFTIIIGIRQQHSMNICSPAAIHIQALALEVTATRKTPGTAIPTAADTDIVQLLLCKCQKVAETTMEEKDGGKTVLVATMENSENNHNRSPTKENQLETNDQIRRGHPRDFPKLPKLVVVVATVEKMQSTKSASRSWKPWRRVRLSNCGNFVSSAIN